MAKIHLQLGVADGVRGACGYPTAWQMKNYNLVDIYRVNLSLNPDVVTCGKCREFIALADSYTASGVKVMVADHGGRDAR